jgi:hypothetical protein
MMEFVRYAVNLPPPFCWWEIGWGVGIAYLELLMLGAVFLSSESKIRRMPKAVPPMYGTSRTGGGIHGKKGNSITRKKSGITGPIFFQNKLQGRKR